MNPNDHTTTSRTQPTACKCGRPTHAGSIWIQPLDPHWTDRTRDHIAARINALIQQTEPRKHGPLTTTARTHDPDTTPRSPWDDTTHPTHPTTPTEPRKRKRRGWFGWLLARAHTRGGRRRQDDK